MSLQIFNNVFNICQLIGDEQFLFLLLPTSQLKIRRRNERLTIASNRKTLNPYTVGHPESDVMV